ncbi:uncharacterized protein BJ171DRAFT_486997 [Polychytrium aggregatum]|uniref:uncharacterized protein n=1 Tax=Polychytrium aggregatum TaxID=110093 RepID=UPI0022FF3F83|nr:uncharacterized protein BJ171DRAFT_486997 [Polychytrium aggregatum]KAI9209439.1 hypothetical protein BJ171DRAFT_486997 [Polychytrium aggregatum]
MKIAFLLNGPEDGSQSLGQDRPRHFPSRSESFVSDSSSLSRTSAPLSSSSTAAYHPHPPPSIQLDRSYYSDTTPRRLAPKNPRSNLQPDRSPRLLSGRLLSRASSLERRFACTHCPSAFRRKQELQRHLRCVHGDETPWVCPCCLKGFGRVDALRSHFSSKKSATTGCRFSLGSLSIPHLVNLSTVSRSSPPA